MDDLDDELRKLFSDDRLDVHSTPITTEAVVAGAGRRKRRRAAVTGTFAVVAVLGAIAGVVQLNAIQHDDTVGALLTTASTTASTTPPPLNVSTYTSTATVTVPVPPSGNGSTNPGTPGSPSSSMTIPSSIKGPPRPTAEAQPGRYGTLSLGMSEADALATGSLLQAGTAPDGRCKTYATKSNSADDAVVISPDRGIVRIKLPDYAKTPKNVGQGSTVADAKTAYANAVQAGTTVTAKMAATPPWSYVFETDGTAVTQVNMRLDANDCASV